MALYEYRCANCGTVDVWVPISRVSESMPCPLCDGQAKRIYSAPGLRRRGSGPVSKAFERAERSQDEPEVVNSLPRDKGGSKPWHKGCHHHH